MIVSELPAHEAPMNLLLLADPDEARVRSYLTQCRAFVIGTPPAGVLLLRSNGGGVCEIMNIAVDPVLSVSVRPGALLTRRCEIYVQPGIVEMRSTNGASSVDVTATLAANLRG